MQESRSQDNIYKMYIFTIHNSPFKADSEDIRLSFQVLDAEVYSHSLNNKFILSLSAFDFFDFFVQLSKNHLANT